MEFVRASLSAKPASKEDALQVLNKEVRPILSYVRGALNRIVSTADVEEPGELEMRGNELIVFVDTSSAAWSHLDEVELPPNPDVGDRITVKDVGGSAAAKNVVVSGNGSTVDGSGGVALIANYSWTTVVYNGTEWSQIGG